MDFEPAFPYVDYSNTNIKNYLVAALSYDYPLSAKKLYYVLKKKYNVNTSYHNVYRAIQELTEKGILSKESLQYQLCVNWIQRNLELARMIKKQYEKEKSINLDFNDGKSIYEFKFNNLLELDEHCMELHNYFYPKLMEDEIVCMIYGHQWWHLIYPKKKYDNEVVNNKFYFVCGGETLLDKQSNNFKKRKGFNVVVKDMARVSDTTIYGYVVVSIYYDPLIRDKMDELFINTKKVEELDVPKMIEEVFGRKTKIVMIINKNKLLAEQLRSRVIGLF